ncbi:adenylosuccinate lyase [bacterium]|nr:adenylosuccinate lyase [bacterium]
MPTRPRRTQRSSAGIDAAGRYDHILAERYASARMAALFSPVERFRLWRRLWVALAEAERALGLPISQAQIAELKRFVDDINLDDARRIEREVRHDVMAHVKAYGLQARRAAGIIHLGATSCYVTDNADLLIYRSALELISDRLIEAVRPLAAFAFRERRRPALGYTHLQPAQLTTVGKRACLWVQDLLRDFEQLHFCIRRLKFLGVKGATGTQASFLALFNGDHRKVVSLEQRVARAFGFDDCFPIAGQTYTRKVDADILSCLDAIAVSAHKMTNDIRYLQSVGELEEPFSEKQIGSSAMAYKRNPMRSERAASLARFIISVSTSPQMTAASQFLERTLDDSANRRLVMPEAFLAADAILILLRNIAAGLVVYPSVIERRVSDALPVMATENLLMRAVACGGDRQQVHERIRVHAMAAMAGVREGRANDLLERIAGDRAIGLSRAMIARELAPRKFVGRAPEQVAEFIAQDVRPLLRRYKPFFPADDAAVKY